MADPGGGNRFPNQQPVANRARIELTPQEMELIATETRKNNMTTSERMIMLYQAVHSFSVGAVSQSFPSQTIKFYDDQTLDQKYH